MASDDLNETTKSFDRYNKALQIAEEEYKKKHSLDKYFIKHFFSNLYAAEKWKMKYTALELSVSKLKEADAKIEATNKKMSKENAKLKKEIGDLKETLKNMASGLDLDGDVVIEEMSSGGNEKRPGKITVNTP